MFPIWAALPRSLQGSVHTLDQPGRATRPAMGRIAMVAGWQDVAPLRGTCQMIYVEHGAGQAYQGKLHDPSYSGSGGVRHRGVIGYVAPSDTVAQRWRAPSVAVGCPKMDQYIGLPRQYRPERTVCFVWHWPCHLLPEAESVWPHYENDFDEIVLRFRAQGFRVIAHEHPKWRGEMTKRMRGFGVEMLESDDDVFKQADIMIVDNSSLAFEFMLLDRPVVFLNAPWYRKDVDHGGRFWEWTRGHPMVDGPDELIMLNLWDWIDPPHLATIRETAAKVYAVRDGTSAAKAAAWIKTLMEAEG